MDNVSRVFRDLQSLPVNAVILDSLGNIVTVSESWKQFAQANGRRLPKFGIDRNYLEYCAPAKSDGSDIATKLHALLTGKVNMVTLVYPCHSPETQRWFIMIAIPLTIDARIHAAIFHVDLSKLVAMPENQYSRGSNDIMARGDLVAYTEVMGRNIEQSVADVLTAQLSSLASVAYTAGTDTVSAASNENALRNVLSKRQLEVLRLLGERKTNSEIAKVLLRSPHTIKLHVSEILRRLKLRSRTEAAVLAAREFGMTADGSWHGHLSSYSEPGPVGHSPEQDFAC